MRQYNRIEYNKLCAEFLGYTNTTPTDPDFSIYENEKGITIKGRLYKLLEPMSMEFDSDWNWIMEVYHKINFLIQEKSTTDFIFATCVDSFHLELWASFEDSHVSLKESKKATVLAIWNFLNWYNENTRIRAYNAHTTGRKLP